ncbi:porin [Ideonella livida]|uniref:Porin n=1 Tax=Ideonella livida TaxID=2707176 RepID=A0A7C9PKE8_9BURK|nr:porin [Ideonella livida]NDY93214.1 porin [Ideonella livida]
MNRFPRRTISLATGAPLAAAAMILLAPNAQAQATPAAGPAVASTSVYGLLDLTVRHASNVRADGSAQNSLTDGAYSSSRFGLRRTQDLGDGLSASFLLEAGYDPSTGVSQQSTASGNNGNAAAPSGRLFGREVSLSLSHTAAGTLSLGRQYTVAHVLSGRFQAQGNANADALSVYSGHHVARQDNMLRYGNTFGPVEVLAAASLDEQAGKGRGLGLAYKASAFELLAYRQDITSADGATTREITGAGGNASFGPAKVFLGWMKRHDDAPTARDHKVRSLGLNWSLTPATTFTTALIKDTQSGAKAGTRTSTTLGLIHQLHRTTDVYVLLDRNTLTGTYSQPDFMGTREAAAGSSLGVRHRF